MPYLSRSVWTIIGWLAKEIPSRCRTAWSATMRAAPRYFFTSAGDIANDSPELSKPSWLAGSTGNSLVGRRSTPVRSRMVLSCSALLSRRASTGPGSPACFFASCIRSSWIHATTAPFCAEVGCCLAFFGGMSPVWSLSSTSSQRAASRTTSSMRRYGLRSKSPFGFSLSWHSRQKRPRNGRTALSNRFPRSRLTASADGAAMAAETAQDADKIRTAVRRVIGIGDRNRCPDVWTGWIRHETSRRNRESSSRASAGSRIRGTNRRGAARSRALWTPIGVVSSYFVGLGLVDSSIRAR
jgi:hypothetical protein